MGTFLVCPQVNSFCHFHFHGERQEGKSGEPFAEFQATESKAWYLREQMAEGFFSSLKIPEVLDLLLSFIDRGCSKIAAPIATISIKQIN